MALTDTNGNLVMPVAPMYGGGMGNGFGGGFGGDSWAWIILLLLLGWGNGNGFGGGFGFGGIGGDLYPWLNNSQNINDGFRDQMLNDTITSIRDGVQNLSTQLCNCCCDMRQEVSNGFFNSEIAANNRQMADMQQNFALSTQLANASADNRLGIANLGAEIAREACADRAAVSDALRDVLEANRVGVQTILTQMCNDKIDSKNEKIADLERQLTMANLAASQTRQTAQITDNIYERLATCPVGTVPVYGEQPIFTCPQNNGGCGCGNF